MYVSLHHFYIQDVMGPAGSPGGKPEARARAGGIFDTDARGKVAFKPAKSKVGNHNKYTVGTPGCQPECHWQVPRPGGPPAVMGPGPPRFELESYERRLKLPSLLPFGHKI
jgi:hypothetical protein